MPLSNTLKNLAVKAISAFVGAPAVIAVLKEPPEVINVQFNPSEYVITEGSTYSEKERARKDDPVVNFNGNPMATLSLKLYFDCDVIPSLEAGIDAIGNLVSGEEGNDISKVINKISGLTKIDGDSHQPPPVAFVWGSLQFIGNVKSVSTTYTMFDKSGKPLRAVVALTIIGIKNEAAGERESPLMSPDRTKARIMTEDTNIWSIAEKEYGDKSEWRRIADANGIMNPLDIPIGKVLRVPSIND